MSKAETWGHVREKLCVLLSDGGLRGNFPDPCSRLSPLLLRQHIQMHIDSAVHQLSLPRLHDASPLITDPGLRVYKCRNHDMHQQTRHHQPCVHLMAPATKRQGVVTREEPGPTTHLHTRGCQEAKAKHIPSQVDKSWKNLHTSLVAPMCMCEFLPHFWSRFALSRSLVSPSHFPN